MSTKHLDSGLFEYDGRYFHEGDLEKCGIELIKFTPKWSPYPETVPPSCDEYFVTCINEKGERINARRTFAYRYDGPYWRVDPLNWRVIAWAPIPLFDIESYDGSDGFVLDGN